MYLHRFIGNSRWLLAAAIIFGFASQVHAVCYVNANATGTGDGSSWTDASTYLQTVLINPLCTEIWVGKGVYKPVLPVPDPSNSFNVQSGVALYGGFAGNETTRDSRNPAANQTVLSGDIDDNDDVDGDQIDRTFADIVGDNSYHVVVMDGTVGDPIESTTLLDGFTITGGNANSSTTVNSSGGGLDCNGKGSGHACSPTMVNMNFIGNYGHFGGAVYSDGGDAGMSSPSFVNSVFVGNGSNLPEAGFGGAIFAAGLNGTVRPNFTNVLFRENRAGFGGAVFITNDSGDGGDSLFSNVTFAANVADLASAIYEDSFGSMSSSTFVNTTFTANYADFSTGPMENFAAEGGVMNVYLSNATFTKNNSVGKGGAIFNISDGSVGAMVSASLSNVVMWNDSFAAGGSEIYNDVGAAASIYSSVIQDGCSAGSTCTNLITTDPLLSKLGNYGGFTPTLRPNTGSSAIDTGDDAMCPATDQRGVARPQGIHCDIGAVERKGLEDIIFKDGFEAF